MDTIIEYFEKTLEDNKFTKAERKALEQVILEQSPNKRQLSVLRSKVFDLAEEKFSGHSAKLILEWLEVATKILYQQNAKRSSASSNSKIYFSPGEECLNAILYEIERCKSSLDVCVFTITDDRIARALIAAHRRGVEVRIISDDDKRLDKGSDIQKMADAGVPTKIDDTPNHMHHKYCVMDNKRVLTGSYNWTRSAERYNHENIIILDDMKAVNSFSNEFDRLWAEFHDL